MAVGVFQGMAKTVSHVSEHLSAMCPVYTAARRPYLRCSLRSLLERGVRAPPFDHHSSDGPVQGLNRYWGFAPSW